MKIEEPETMRMLRAIRSAQSEEMKDMSLEEQTAHEREKAEELMNRFSLSLRNVSKLSR